MSKLPSRFGPYELVRRLGAGGMAETFLAVRRGPGGFEQHLCLKRILPAFEDDAEFVRLFLEEARIAARLRHTNVVQVLDFGVVEGSHFLALELVDGLDMRIVLERLRRDGQAMTSGLVSYLAFELGAALEFAHAAGPDGAVKGVVHRDISPSNVLLSVAGEVKLTDFGIAKAMSETHVTRSGTIKGKVPYMAPEYALRMEFDARSDLFALGVTLYEALAGCRPFDGVTDLDTLRRIQDGEHTPLSDIVPTAPRALVETVERLITPDRAMRFQNAAELLDALVDVAPPPTSRRILGELVRRCVAQRAEEIAASEVPPAPDSDVAFAPTAHGTPRGTLMVAQAAPAPAAEVRAAAPDEETRTRAPEPSDVPLTREAAHAHALRGTAPVPGEGRTELDAATAEAHAVAAAETRELPGAMSGVPAAGTETVRLPRRSVPGWVWALAVLLVGGGAAAAWVAAQGGDEVPASVGAPAPSEEPDPAAPERAHEPAEAAAAAGVAAPPEAEAVERTEPTDAPAAEERESAREARRDPRRPAGRREERRGAQEQPAPAAGQERAPAAAPARQRDTRQGAINVIVIPFGDVWIDGRRIGPAPVTVEVPAGRHVVATGDGSPTRRVTVQVEPGQRRQVVLR